MGDPPGAATRPPEASRRGRAGSDGPRASSDADCLLVVRICLLDARNPKVAPRPHLRQPARRPPSRIDCHARRSAAAPIRQPPPSCSGANTESAWTVSGKNSSRFAATPSGVCLNWWGSRADRVQSMKVATSPSFNNPMPVRYILVDRQRVALPPAATDRRGPGRWTAARDACGRKGSPRREHRCRVGGADSGGGFQEPIGRRRISDIDRPGPEGPSQVAASSR